ncbi:MAG: glycosyl hydrolase family 8, partial [Proteobacteria bacterium]|nr:glycosyl hydrolase family 8 [Pseudomonadota bacterium]
MYSNKVKFFLLVLITSVFTSLFLLQHKSRRSHQEALQKRTTELNELHGLWLKYKEKSIINGRVIAHDENGITTSEGQSYAMLRAVWSNDTQGFSEIWNWTKTNLKRPKDHLFSWKWKNHIIDANTATDADSDIALALILGSRRFKNQTYLDQAKLIISDLKKIDFVTVGRWNIPHAGNWTHKDRYIKVHIGYLSSYAYREFGQIDPTFDWDRVANDSTALIHWLLSDKKIKFLPEYVFLDRKTGDIHIKHPETNQQADFGYDVFPLFWRLAVDAQWNNQDHSTIGDLLLKPFKSEMYDKQKIFDRYSIQANQLSHHEADTLYLTLSSLSESIDPLFYKLISDSKLGAIWRRANSDEALPYYVQNWIWFHKALQLGAVENFSSNP